MHEVYQEFCPNLHPNPSYQGSLFLYITMIKQGVLLFHQKTVKRLQVCYQNIEIYGEFINNSGIGLRCRQSPDKNCYKIYEF